MKYDVLMLDMDGTIVNAFAGIDYCLECVTRDLGLRPLTLEEKLSFIGPPLDDTFVRIYGMGEAELRKTMSLYLSYASKTGYSKAVFYDGIFSILEKVKGKFKKIGVVTLKNQATAIQIIENLNATEFFDFVVGKKENIPATKADLIRTAIGLAGIENPRCLLVGDSEFDALGAKETGIDFIGVTYGFGFKAPNHITNYSYLAYANTVEELSKLLDNYID